VYNVAETSLLMQLNLSIKVAKLATQGTVR
jgi:hypothetical protein